jgi:hypothetical protein
MARYIGTTNTSSAIKTAGGGFTGGNQSANDLYVFMQLLAGIYGSAKGVYSINQVYDQINTSTWSTTYFAPSAANVSPTSGGTMTVNSQSVGSYDYTVKVGNQTISSFVNSDWFTTTADTRSALIYVSGNLTINAGQTLIPSNRKLFTAIYVNGNLTINGAVSMTDMGSNHNGTGNSGGAVTAVAVRLATGTFSGVSNPQLPATGGAGGPGSTGSTAPAGTAGTAGGTGGGGGGSGNGGLGGSGQAGTSFVGGSGGGGTRGNAATPGTANGGSGGPANTDGLGGGGGGAGQPGGPGAQSGPYPSVAGATGIGGVIVIYCTGTFSGTGSIVSNGEPGGTGWNAGGGGSGAGSITVFYGTDSSSITPAATGGSGGPSNAGGAPGGAGGAGTARKLSF